MDTNKTSAVEAGAIIYNVTVNVEHVIANDWLQWMLHEHIPEVMQSGCFMACKVARLLEVDDTDGPTYAIQYTAASKELYDIYIDEFAFALRQKTIDKWGDRFIAVRTVMEVVK